MTENDNLELLTVTDNDAKQIIELDDCLERLMKNPDFIKVFVQHYLGQFVSDKASLLTNPQLRTLCMEKIIATSHFRDYISDIHSRALTYKAEIVNNDNVFGGDE